MQTFTYQPAPNHGVATYALYALCISIAINAALICTAALGGGGWGAVFVILVIGPIANVIFVIVSLALIPAVRRRTGGESVKRFVLAAMLTPVGAMVVDIASIFLMPGGC